MGFFSWITQDSGESIPNSYVTKHFRVINSDLSTFPIYMTDDKGNVWKEENYEGYGVFGGKDFYELLAEMNALKTRDEGINLVFSDADYISPNLNRSSNSKWKNEHPKSCPHQGYFYTFEEEDYDDEEDDLDYIIKY